MEHMGIYPNMFDGYIYHISYIIYLINIHQYHHVQSAYEYRSEAPLCAPKCHSGILSWAQAAAGKRVTRGAGGQGSGAGNM